MFYHEYSPLPELTPYIQCFWMLEHDYREPFHTHEHLWADTHTELIFTFGERYYRRINGRKKTLPQNFVIGPQTKELLLYSDGFTGFIATRFHPWGFTAFSTKNAITLVDNIVPADKTLGQLQDKSREEKLTLLTTHFMTHLPIASPHRQKVQSIATTLKTQHGIQKITDLAAQFHISPRMLERHFLQYIGLPAKLFARILRFNYARTLIEQDPDIGLAALAYETGYADQAHFSKNFRQLFNFTPAEFKARVKKFKADTAGRDHNVVFVQD